MNIEYLIIVNARFMCGYNITNIIEMRSIWQFAFKVKVYMAFFKVYKFNYHGQIQEQKYLATATNENLTMDAMLAAINLNIFVMDYKIAVYGSYSSCYGQNLKNIMLVTMGVRGFFFIFHYG